MALTYTEVLVTNVGPKKMSIYVITGDGSTTAISAASMKLQYAEAAFMTNLDDTGGGLLTTYYGTALAVGTAIANTKKQMIVAFGY